MLFDKRVHYKPFEYPEVLTFIEKINQTYWVHSEVNFDADLQEFRTQLTQAEQSAILNCLKAISQIEVAVKSYWGNLYNYIPKPEFAGLGATFAENEFRHSEAYSRLLDVLGINDFADFCQLAPIQKRIEYLSTVNQKNIKDAYTFCRSMAIFSIAVENASLFSQFATVLSFQRFKGLMKNMADQISWTSLDEDKHMSAGIWIINKAVEEYRINLDTLFSEIRCVILECSEAEDEIIDLIFEEGELDFLPKIKLKQFFRYRIDRALEKMHMPTVFGITKHPMLWFDEIVFGPNQKDFFVSRPADYSKHDMVFSADDLF